MRIHQAVRLGVEEDVSETEALATFGSAVGALEFWGPEWCEDLQRWESSRRANGERIARWDDCGQLLSPHGDDGLFDDALHAGAVYGTVRLAWAAQGRLVTLDYSSEEGWVVTVSGSWGQARDVLQRCKAVVATASVILQAQ
jgi:hypothetical protein